MGRERRCLAWANHEQWRGCVFEFFSEVIVWYWELGQREMVM